MWLFKFFYLGLGYIFGYLFFMNVAFAQTNSASTEFVLFYKNEFTFLLCLITLVLGTWLGVKLPAGVGEPELSKSIKFVNNK